MVAFGLQQDSEYRELFNHHLKKLNEEGILDKLADMYMPKRNSPQAILEAIPLGYDNVFFPSLVMFIGILSSLLMVCIEKIRRYTYIKKSEKLRDRAMAWVIQDAEK